MMNYRKFEQGTWNFPKPKVPALPTLGRHSLSVTKSRESRHFGGLPNTRFYCRSRYALTDAYRLCGVGSTAALLAPAYHCRTMLDPAIRLGAKVALYPLNTGLNPDLDQLKACISNSDIPIAALLVTHYFGFQQALEEVLTLCSAQGIALIEDCSHCLLTESAPNGLGRQGRYSVWSPYKFFPCEDGGVLWANHGAQLPVERPYAASIFEEVRGLARAVQRGLENRAKPDAVMLNQDIESFQRDSTSASQDTVSTSLAVSAQYDMLLEGRACLVGSRWIMQHTDVERLVRSRRRNYEKWAHTVAGLPHSRALFPSLPDHCVPYMFPLLIENPAVHFLALKFLGMTEWRWDDMAVSACPIATAYRLQLLHLPCHQEITTEQMDWMTSAVTRVLNQIPPVLTS